MPQLGGGLFLPYGLMVFKVVQPSPLQPHSLPKLFSHFSWCCCQEPSLAFCHASTSVLLSPKLHVSTKLPWSLFRLAPQISSAFLAQSLCGPTAFCRPLQSSSHAFFRLFSFSTIFLPSGAASSKLSLKLPSFFCQSALVLV